MTDKQQQNMIQKTHDLIDNLGVSSEDIARSLRKLKITGTQKNTYTCPIANYLKKGLRRYKIRSLRVESGFCHLFYDVFPKNVIVDFPRCCGQFVRDFDSGKYKYLIHKLK